MKYTAPEMVEGLRVFRKKTDSKRVLVEVHPLWQADHPTVAKTLARLRQADAESTPRLVNAFRLLRRPADYV